MAVAIRSRGGKVNSMINVAPMVDVMLVLLIIFMVITPLLQPPGPPVQMARAANPRQMPGADKEDALLVAINRDGQVFLGNEAVSKADLTEEIRDRVAGRTDKEVFVKADARVHYLAVVGVVDDIRSAGVSELSLLTEQRRQ